MRLIIGGKDVAQGIDGNLPCLDPLQSTPGFSRTRFLPSDIVGRRVVCK